MRLVKTSSGIKVDFAGRESGRGFYICPDDGCMEKALKNKQVNWSGIQDWRELKTMATQAVVRETRRHLELAERMGVLDSGREAALPPDSQAGEVILGSDVEKILSVQVANGSYPGISGLQRCLAFLDRLSSKGLSI